MKNDVQTQKVTKAKANQKVTKATQKVTKATQKAK